MVPSYLFDLFLLRADIQRRKTLIFDLKWLGEAQLVLTVKSNYLNQVKFIDHKAVSTKITNYNEAVCRLNGEIVRPANRLRPSTVKLNSREDGKT